MRSSGYINFDCGTVLIAPMDLVAQKSTPWSLDDKIEIFECRVDVWQLGPAVAVLNSIEANQHPSSWSHAAYAMISIAFSYFEMIGKSVNPASAASGTAGRDFNYGFCDVYYSFRPADGDHTDGNLPVVKQFRDRVRNGMYHLAYTKKNLWIHNDPSLSSDDFHVTTDTPPRYLLNPHQMVRTIVDHFPTFVTRLRDTTNGALRKKFEEFFDDFHT